MEFSYERFNCLGAIHRCHKRGIRISEKVSAEDIQSLARELQLIRNQIQTVSSQVSEYSITIEAL